MASSKRSKSVLIIECDANKLASQSLSLCDEIKNIIGFTSPKSNLQIIKTDATANLLPDFACMLEDNSRFDLVLVIAHSNATGLSLTKDKFVSWGELGIWIKPFKPKIAIFVACQAGKDIAVESVFENTPSLKEIYASPINTSKSQSEIVKMLVPYLLHSRVVDDQLIFLGQIFNYFMTTGIIFRWHRDEFDL